MSLVNCPECKAEVSNKAGQCIHCGFPILSETSLLSTADIPDREIKAHKSSELQLHKVIDILFSLLYLYLFYVIFISEKTPVNLDEGAAWFGVFLTFVLIYFVQKMAKAILGTVARSFDGLFNKKNAQ
jgi:hypothetical protein